MVKTLVVPDIHLPFNCKKATRKMLKWAKEEQPDEVVFLGDVIDLHALTTHRQNREWQDSLEAEISTTLVFLQKFRDMVPRAKMTYLKGNHEDRWDRQIDSRMPAMRLIGISLNSYLGLDHMGIDYNDEGKGYRIKVGRGQTVRCFHGHEIKGGSKFPGGHALKFAQRLGENVHIGHTHKLGVAWTVMGGQELFAVEGGYLADPDGPGLEYAGPAPDWKQGWCVYDTSDKDSPLPQVFTP